MNILLFVERVVSGEVVRIRVPAIEGDGYISIPFDHLKEGDTLALELCGLPGKPPARNKWFEVRLNG